MTQLLPTDRSLILHAQPIPKGAPDWRWQEVQKFRQDNPGKRPPAASDGADPLVRQMIELLYLRDRRASGAKALELHRELQWALEIHLAGGLVREAMHAYILANLTPDQIAEQVECVGLDGRKCVETYEQMFFNVRSRLKSQLFIRSIIDAYARSPSKTDLGLTLLQVGYKACITGGGIDMVNSILHPGTGTDASRGRFDSMIRYAAQTAAVSVLSSRNLARDQAAAEHIAQYGQMRASWVRADAIVADHAPDEMKTSQKNLLAGMAISLRSVRDVTPVHITPHVKDQMRGTDMQAIEKEIAARRRGESAA